MLKFFFKQRIDRDKIAFKNIGFSLMLLVLVESTFAMDFTEDSQGDVERKAVMNPREEEYISNDFDNKPNECDQKKSLYFIEKKKENFFDIGKSTIEFLSSERRKKFLTVKLPSKIKLLSSSFVEKDEMNNKEVKKKLILLIKILEICGSSNDIESFCKQYAELEKNETDCSGLFIEKDDSCKKNLKNFLAEFYKEALIVYKREIITCLLDFLEYHTSKINQCASTQLEKGGTNYFQDTMPHQDIKNEILDIICLESMEDVFRKEKKIIDLFCEEFKKIESNSEKRLKNKMFSTMKNAFHVLSVFYRLRDFVEIAHNSEENIDIKTYFEDKNLYAQENFSNFLIFYQKESEIIGLNYKNYDDFKTLNKIIEFLEEIKKTVELVTFEITDELKNRYNNNDCIAQHPIVEKICVALLICKSVFDRDITQLENRDIFDPLLEDLRKIIINICVEMVEEKNMTKKEHQEKKIFEIKAIVNNSKNNKIYLKLFEKNK